MSGTNYSRLNAQQFIRSKASGDQCPWLEIPALCSECGPQLLSTASTNSVVLVGGRTLESAETSCQSSFIHF